jgi:hypothetical protein
MLYTMGAFRTADGSEVLEAPTHEGTLRLEVAPRHVTLTLGAVQFAITDEFVSVAERKRRTVRRESLRLRGRLLVARDVPHDDLGLWLEVEPLVMRRIFGAQPRDLLTEEALTALRALDRLVARLRQVLAHHAGGVRRAFEVGRGLDKVLVVDHGDHLVVFARRLFGEVSRRIVEVHADGTVVIPRRSERRFTIRERWGIVLTGDLIRFIDPHGTDLGSIALHWIGAEDRGELVRRFGDMIEGHPSVELTGSAGRTATLAAIKAGRGRYQPRVPRFRKKSS